VLCAISLVAGGIYWAVMALATGERVRAFKTISPVMLTPLAVVFAFSSGFWRPRSGTMPSEPTAP
jgi:hypothetical protein